MLPEVLKCITKTLEATKTQPSTYSLCRKEWQVPSPGGAAALPKNYVASSFKDSVPATVQSVLADGDELEHEPVEYSSVQTAGMPCVWGAAIYIVVILSHVNM